MRSNHVELIMVSFWGASAFGADAEDFETVTVHEEAVSLSDGFENQFDFVVLELFQLATFFADHVIVLRVAVIVFPDFLAVRASDFAN